MRLFFAGLAIVVAVGCMADPRREERGDWEGEWVWRGKAAEPAQWAEISLSIKPTRGNVWKVLMTLSGADSPQRHFEFKAVPVSDTELRGEETEGDATVRLSLVREQVDGRPVLRFGFGVSAPGEKTLEMELIALERKP